MVITSTMEAEQVSPVSSVWALNSILLPSLVEGIKQGKIARSRRWSSDEEQCHALLVLFGYAMAFMRSGIEPTLERLAGVVRARDPASVHRMLSTVRDWNWLIDRVRLRDSGHGTLSIASSAMIIRSEPVSRSGASVFGVASRSIPAAVLKALAEQGLAPDYNYPPNSNATDCSAWLVEIAEHWSLALRVEPLVERTWFDPGSYDEAQRPFAEAALRRAHGDYLASDMAIVRKSLIDSYLASVAELAGDATGLRYESGCLQRGEMGKETCFVGGQLGQITAIDRRGACPFLDLPRLSPHHPRARGGAPLDPWSGQVAVGEQDCSFLLDGESRPRSSQEMAWAAQAALQSKGPPELRGIFRPVSGAVIREAGCNPDDVRYVYTRAKVGKHGASIDDRVEVGFLVRDYRGEVSSGWSITFGDIHNPLVQRAAIALAEAHCKRMGPRGRFRETIEYLRGGGVQRNKAHTLPQIRARHGLFLVADVLNTRAALGV